MEFPDLVNHCQQENCNQTDFLPLQCQCLKIFCRYHFNEHCLSGECELAPKPKEINFKSDAEVFMCTSKNCKKGSYIKMLCPKCQLHFCIEHRFHPECPEIEPEILAVEKEKWDAPRRQFEIALENIQSQITENFRKALQSSNKAKTASKVHLMRIKQKATGNKTIPVPDRVYFSVTKPKDNTSKPINIVKSISNVKKVDIQVTEVDNKDGIPLFVSKNWSLGRMLDAVCDQCSVINMNNNPSVPKIRLFRQFDGYCLNPIRMDASLSDMMKSEVLLNGDRLHLEYLSNDDLSKISEKDQVFLAKYPLE